MSKLVKVQSKKGKKIYELSSEKADALVKGGNFKKVTSGKAINSKKLEKKAEKKDDDKGSLMGGRVVNLKTNLFNQCKKLKDNGNNLGIFLRKHLDNKLKRFKKKS